MAQVKPLQILMSEHAYQPILFPTLEIEALESVPFNFHYNAVIFISTNAVKYGLRILKTLNYQQVFAVGAKTASKLTKNNIKVDAFPVKKPSSKTLLAMSKLKALNGQSILIFRGEGGMETLKEGLKKNNFVEYIEVYRRIKCPISDLHKTSLFQFFKNNKGVVTATSVENLNALLLIAQQINTNAPNLIKCYPLVVLSERIKIAAQFIGFKRIEIASEISDVGLLKAVQSIDF